MNATIQITEKCNLKCKYCFEGEKSNVSITDNLGKHGIDFTFNKFFDELLHNIKNRVKNGKEDKSITREVLHEHCKLNEYEIERLIDMKFLLLEEDRLRVNHNFTKNVSLSELKDIYLLQKFFNIPFLILFYGGEIFTEFRLFKYLLQYADDKAKKSGINIKFEIITNAFDIDEHMIYFIQSIKNIKIKVSIDGDAESHNANRITCNGLPSFDKVIENSKKLLKVNDKLIVATVITPETAANLANNIKFLYNLGFKSFQFGIEQIYSKWDEQSLKVLENQYIELGIWYSDRKLNDEDIEIDDINTKILLLANNIKSIQKCESGEYKYFINISGDIYPCPISNNVQELKFGDLKKGFYKNNTVNLFKDIDVDSCDNTCKECINKYKCHITCFANNILSTGKLSEVSESTCKINKKLLNSCTVIGNYLYDKNSKYFRDNFYINNR